jgi:hypothetical protein
MNTQFSVNAPARSRSASLLRRFVATAAMGVALLGVTAAFADDFPKEDNYSITTFAGATKSYLGKLSVRGSGKFTAKDDGANLVFTTVAGNGDDGNGEIHMLDKRQPHTVGPKSKVGLPTGHAITLKIEKSKLNFPADGQEASGEVPGTLSFRGVTKPIKKISYKVKGLGGGKYLITSANFSFKYTDHMPATGKKDQSAEDEELDRRVCLIGVCVAPSVTISVIKPVTVEAKK